MCDSQCSVGMFASPSDITYTVSFCFLLLYSINFFLQNAVCNNLYSGAKDNSLL